MRTPQSCRRPGPAASYILPVVGLSRGEKGVLSFVRVGWEQEREKGKRRLGLRDGMGRATAQYRSALGSDKGGEESREVEEPRPGEDEALPGGTAPGPGPRRAPRFLHQ